MNWFRNRHFRAFALIAPLTIFLGIFFVWPLATILYESVSDQAVSSALPLTKEASADWRAEDVPGANVRSSFVKDLQALDDQSLGDLVRRLNAEQPGFRTLMGKTIAAIRNQEGKVDLTAVDARWGKVEYWKTVHNALAPYSDRNFLGALDLVRGQDGSIVSVAGGESANRAIMIRTILIAGLVTLACILIGLPYALVLASASGWFKQLLFGAVLLPLWTSLLVRTAAWYVLLQDRGLINEFLIRLGVISSPLPLMFNRVGVVIAMTHVLLPFMVLPIYSVLVTVPPNLMFAAASLGAKPTVAFRRVLLPLSLRGITSGTLLVFMAAIGYYITPALIGGPNDQMISSVIAFYALGSANWGMASALGIILLAVTLILYVIYSRLSGDPAAPVV